MEPIDSQSGAFKRWNILGPMLRRYKTSLIFSFILILVSLNILTLLNDDIHTAGYNAVKSIIFSVASDAIATQILSKSPSVKTQAAIKTATKVLSDQAITLTTSNKLLSNQVTNLSASNKRVQDSFVKLTSSNAVLLSQNHKLTTSNLELENKHANMQSAYKKTIQKVTKRISVRSVANASRNAAAVTGEAVPVIGTALIVGVTAWDIYDACETLKDVNELSSMVGQEQANLDKVCGIKIPSQEQVLAQVRRNWRAAYQSAAGFVNTAGATVKVSVSPPELSWADIKSTVCPVVGAIPVMCP